MNQLSSPSRHFDFTGAQDFRNVSSLFTSAKWILRTEAPVHALSTSRMLLRLPATVASIERNSASRMSSTGTQRPRLERVPFATLDVLRNGKPIPNLRRRILTSVFLVSFREQPNEQGS